ncbi:hypothetical protein HDA40_006525 [Hamadaea flava]|uniref:Uncharacterized protein n=1 Tax=Hamadaea flava TaxID=1742688 RepID=A0ABV8LTN9_9ACTN|nr:hypothetical protein [Hamadaea flava]MCP2328018.1 hypothetical protein [Hamadaea flava]
MKNRVLLVLVIAAGVVWLAGDKIASWVRPVALAVFAGSLALLLWPRIRPSGRSSSSPSSATSPSSDPSKPESTKDLWDAVDRGEDPTAR